MTNAVRWAANAAAPVEVDAPLCVEVTAWEQAEENRRVIHLVNVQSDIGRTVTIKGGVGQATRENLHVIQEILPVYDLVVRFRAPEGKAVKQVTLQPDGVALSVTQNGPWTSCNDTEDRGSRRSRHRVGMILHRSPRFPF